MKGTWLGKGTGAIPNWYVVGKREGRLEAYKEVVEEIAGFRSSQDDNGIILQSVEWLLSERINELEGEKK